LPPPYFITIDTAVHWFSKGKMPVSVVELRVYITILFLYIQTYKHSFDNSALSACNTSHTCM